MPNSFNMKQTNLTNLPLVMSDKTWDLIMEPEPSIEGLERLCQAVCGAYDELLKAPEAKQWSFWILSQEPCIECEFPEEIGLNLTIELQADASYSLRISLLDEVVVS